jgi:ABC-type anion transport system duplicated permease subunit
MVFLPAVVKRADRMGGIVAPVVSLLLIEQAVPVLVHVPSVVRFSVYPLYKSAVVMFRLVVSLVRVGIICSPSEVTKELAGSSVTHSKEPVLLKC